MHDATSILLKKSTKAKLKKLGMKGETYNDIINRLIDDGLGEEENNK
jgi:hypothetical protein